MTWGPQPDETRAKLTELEEKLGRHIERFSSSSLINQAAALLAFLEKEGLVLPEPLTLERSALEQKLARRLTRISLHQTPEERAAAILAALRN